MTDTASWNGKLVFFLGVNSGFVSGQLPDARFLNFYSQRSSRRLHCAIVGNVVIPNGHGSNRSTPSIGSDLVWSKLAAAITAGGSIPGIQLATAWEGYEGARNFLSADGGRVIGRAKELVSKLGSVEIERTLDSFKSGAVLAIDHGFKHIQFHAAHGYLLSLLIDERINDRADLVYERLASIAVWLRDQGAESSLRISMRTGNDDFDAQGTESLQERAANLPFDFVDLSSGFYNINKRLIYPSLEDVIRSRLSESIEIAERHPRRQFILSGRISQWLSELPKNAHVGLCRDLIANSNFLAEPDNGCRNHSKCHYFSRGEGHITCPRWNETASENA